MWLTRSTPPLNTGVVGAGGDLVNAEALVDGAGILRAEVLPIAGDKRDQASPEMDVDIDEDVRARRGDLNFCRNYMSAR